jgi:hypothetical protein
MSERQLSVPILDARKVVLVIFHKALYDARTLFSLYHCFHPSMLNVIFLRKCLMLFCCILLLIMALAEGYALSSSNLV